MKKSNAFMLSYIVFLLIALIANWFLNWQGLEKIALAATLAGVLFAFADLTNWFISFEQDFCHTMLQVCETLKTSAETTISFSEDRIAEDKGVIEEITSFEGTHVVLQETQKYAEEDLLLQQNHINKVLEIKKGEESLKNITLKKEANLKNYRRLESLLVILGFVSFFSIIVFDCIFSWISTKESSLTVIAFAVIMLTYFLKDVFEDKYKKQLEEGIRGLKASEEGIEKIRQDLSQRKMLVKTKEVIEALKTNNELKTAYKNALLGE